MATRSKLLQDVSSKMARNTRAKSSKISNGAKLPSALASSFEAKPKRKKLTVTNKRKSKSPTAIKIEETSPGTSASATRKRNVSPEETKVKLEPESDDDSIIRDIKVEPDVTPTKSKRRHIKLEYEDVETTENSDDIKNEIKTDWEPENWREILSNIRMMRSAGDAPVDDMGCDKCYDETAPPPVMRYQILIALMLSSKTRDQVTYAAMKRLREHGLTVDNILNTPDETLEKLIYPVGFWKNKVKYIKKTTQRLKDFYDSDIPKSFVELCKLIGVGPKMAHICMSVGWNEITGIGVDTHVHRISNRLEWVQRPTHTLDATREALQTWLPKELWAEVNHLLVGFGQMTCLPLRPKCDICLNKNLCPVGMKSN